MVPAGRFDSTKASFVLGLTLALMSPWNIAFRLTAINRPELAQQGTVAMLTVIVGVAVAALGWGALWSGIVLVLRRSGAGRLECGREDAHWLDGPSLYLRKVG